ncbi:MAG: hypothetical protein JWO31_450 [Phycisphaerales bacterium]|nr:hypothetical protein [Phycisphaerales bacterium]
MAASPFPGMDPYVEGPAQWPDFHVTFINALREAIGETLPEPFFARIQEDVLLLEPEMSPPHRAVPDVLVGSDRPARAGGSAAATLAPTAHENLIALDPYTEYHIEIVRLPEAEVVTVVEVLSPANKAGGGRGLYVNKRGRILRSDANLVEFDLLRAGRRVPLARPFPAGHYHAVVSRADRRPACDIYSWSVRDPLPTIPIPLREPASDASANLAAAFAVAWQRGRYDRFIRYAGPPPDPAFSPVDAGWVAAVTGAAAH